jgi:HEAT repeat protein
MAARQLGRMKASPELQKASLTLLVNTAKSSPRPMVRVAAIQSLEQADAVSAYDTLSDLATKPGDPNIRSRAMAALAALGRDEKLRDRTFTALSGWLDDPDYAVRPWAARALGRLGDPRAVGPLTAAANTPRTVLEKEALEGALRSLRSAPDQRALPAGLVDRLASMEKENVQLKERLADVTKRLGALETKKEAPAK